MKHRWRITLGIMLGIILPALLATGACWMLWASEPADFTGKHGVRVAAFRSWYTALEIGVLVTALGVCLGFILSRVANRHSRNLQTALRNTWESISGRQIFPENGEDPLVASIRSIAIEFNILRNSENDQKSKVIRLEHELREKDRVHRAGEREIGNLVQAKSRSDRTIDSLRSQLKDVEDKIASSRLVRGDSWFAAVVRELLTPLAADRAAETSEEAPAPERQVLHDLLDLANLCRESADEGRQSVNVGEILEQSINKLRNKGRVKFLLSPFATSAVSNPLALILLLDRILIEVDQQNEDVTIRAWRQRASKGKDKIRVAIEQHSQSIKSLVDCVALHGLATLAGTVVKTEHISDDRIAQVIYLEAANSGSGTRGGQTPAGNAALMARRRTAVSSDANTAEGARDSSAAGPKRKIMSLVRDPEAEAPRASKKTG